MCFTCMWRLGQRFADLLITWETVPFTWETVPLTWEMVPFTWRSVVALVVCQLFLWFERDGFSLCADEGSHGVTVVLLKQILPTVLEGKSS